MNFAQCIDLAVQSGRLKPEKGAEAKKAWQDHYDEARLTMSERAADDHASIKAVETMKLKTSDMKWKKVHQIRVAARYVSDPLLKADPEKFYREAAQRLEFTRRRVIGQAQAYAAELVDQGRPRFLGMYAKDMENVIYASYGETKDPVAINLFEQERAVGEWLRKQANRNGTNIPEDPNYRVPQRQSRDKLRAEVRAIRKQHPSDEAAAAAAKATWIDFQMKRADWGLMKYDGLEVPVQKREGYLSDMYDSIFTDGAVRIIPGYKRVEALASRLSRKRSYYKDAKSWLEAQQRYGDGNVYHQLMNNMDTMARSVAMLEHFGPDPTEMVNYVHSLADKRAGELDSATGGLNKVQPRVQKEKQFFDDSLKIFNRQVATADSRRYKAVATARTVSTAGILNAAFISQVGDFALADTAFKFYNMPMTGYIRNYLVDFARLPFKQRRMEALRLGAGMESAVHLAQAQQQRFGMLDGYYVGQRLADGMYRATGMTPWAQAGQHQILRMWEQYADHSNLPFDKVPFAPQMKEFGITAQDWEVFRKTPHQDPEGVNRLYPPDIEKVKGVDAVVKQRIADKFFDFAVKVNMDVSPQVNLRELAMTGHAIDQNVWQGQQARILGTVKTFPLMVFTRYFHQVMAQAGLGGKLALGASFFATMTLAGAFITQMKEMALHGRDPLNMDPRTKDGQQFWIRSALNGGSFGFAGDLIFGALGEFQHGGFADLMSGPFPTFLDDTMTAFVKDPIAAARALAGDGKQPPWARDTLNWATKYAPIPWEVKLAFQRAVADELLRMSDPKAYREMLAREKRRLTQSNQGS